MRKDIQTLEFKYEGDRFDGGRMPVIMLADLQAFRELVISFAEDEWSRRNPSSSALGKGFSESVGIDLVNITNKCALLQMESFIIKDDVSPMDTSREEIIPIATKNFVDLYDKASKGIYPKSLPSRKMDQIKIIGKHLKGNNHIVIGANDNGEAVIIDMVTRKAILDNCVEITKERIFGTGRLFGAQTDGIVSIQSLDHGKIKLKLSAENSVALGKRLSSVVCYDLKATFTSDRNIKGNPEVVRVDVMSEEQFSAIDAAINSVKQAAFSTPISRDVAYRIIKQRPLLSHHFIASSNGDEGIIFEFTKDHWMWSIEVNSDGSCEIYGIEIDGPDQVSPIVHESMSDDFIDLIDEKIGG